MRRVEYEDFARIVSFAQRRAILDSAKADMERQERLAQEEWAQISAGLLTRYGTTSIDPTTGEYQDEP